MPFLALNGVTIPTAKGGTVDIVEVGAKIRAFDGTLLRDVRAFKRKFMFQTKPIAELRALSLIGLINGTGYYFPFDADTYAANGLGGTGSIPLVSSVAADGAIIYDENGVTQTRTATGGAAFADGAAVNLVSAAMSLPSTTAGFGADSGGTISLDGANYFAGTSSLKVVTSSTSGTGMFLTTLVTGALNTGYTASFYFKSPSPINFTFKDSANHVNANAVVTPVSSTTWKRASLQITTPASGLTPTFQINAVTTTSGSLTFYMGGLQIEASAGTNSWLLGGATRTSTTIGYPANPMGPQGMTVNWWQTIPVTGTRHILTAWNGTANEQIDISEPSAAQLNVRIKTGSYDATSQALMTMTNGWDMLTVVLRAKPDVGETNFYAYFNGVLKGSGSVGQMPLNTLTSFYIGSIFGATPVARNRLDDVQILPYPVDANTVTGWYTGATVGPTPIISATGGALQDVSANVVGQINKVDMVGFADVNGWHPNGRVLSFTLEEV